MVHIELLEVCIQLACIRDYRMVRTLLSFWGFSFLTREIIIIVCMCGFSLWRTLTHQSFIGFMHVVGNIVMDNLLRTMLREKTVLL